MFFLTILDVFISSTVISPLVVTFWITTWEFLHKFPKIFPPGWTLYFCLVICITSAILREPIYEICSSSGKLCAFIITRFYVYINVTFGVAAWKFGWLLMERNFGTVGTYAALGVGLVGLCILCGAANLLSVPHSVGLDHDLKSIFLYPTAYNIKSSDRMWLYLLDCIFSICFIGTLVVFVWRGTWCLLDLLLLPDNPVMSAWASAVIGYTLVVVTFSLQPLMKYLAKSLTGLIRLIIVDLYLLFSFCGTVNVWRGVWNLLNHYFLPGLPNTSFILTHLGSFLILMLINSSNSILVRGVYLDGEEMGEQCVDFPCYYIRLFFQARRRKKLFRECEKKRLGSKHNGEVETMAILQQDTKKPIVIVPIKQNNNDLSLPIV